MGIGEIIRRPLRIVCPLLLGLILIVHFTVSFKSLGGQVGAVIAERSGTTPRRSSAKLPSVPSAPAKFKVPPNLLVIFEIYHNRHGWFSLHDEPPFRGFCATNDSLRPRSSDIYGPHLLDLFHQRPLQQLLSEYGPMFAVDKHANTLLRDVQWVGFQSWKAESKGFALWREGVRGMVESLTSSSEKAPRWPQNTIFYWVDGYSPKDLFAECEDFHPRCTQLFTFAFQRLLKEPQRVVPLETKQRVGRKRKFTTKAFPFPADFPQKGAILTQLPAGKKVATSYSFCSYWLMHKQFFREYMRFARAVVTILEGTWNVRFNRDRCPLGFDEHEVLPNRCWAFILERLVNVWVYYRGMHMVYINPRLGFAVEQYPLFWRRTSTFFRRARFETALSAFEQSLDGEILELFELLGGNRSEPARVV